MAGAKAAGTLGALKKDAAVAQAEQLLAGRGWLPDCLRVQPHADASATGGERSTPTVLPGPRRPPATERGAGPERAGSGDRDRRVTVVPVAPRPGLAGLALGRVAAPCRRAPDRTGCRRAGRAWRAWPAIRATQPRLAVEVLIDRPTATHRRGRARRVLYWLKVVVPAPVPGGAALALREGRTCAAHSPADGGWTSGPDPAPHVCVMAADHAAGMRDGRLLLLGGQRQPARTASLPFVHRYRSASVARRAGLSPRTDARGRRGGTSPTPCAAGRPSPSGASTRRCGHRRQRPGPARLHVDAVAAPALVALGVLVALVLFRRQAVVPGLRMKPGLLSHIARPRRKLR